MAVSPSTEPPKKRSASILGTLRAAIKKVRFLLSSSATRWILLSSVARGTPRRALSFNPRSPSLLDAAEGGLVASPASSRTSRSTSMGTATTRSVSRTSSVSTEVLTRTSSGGSASAGGDSDIDRRADEFIANFYKRLQMERQVSLQLRYVRGNSWDRTP